ncbi:MAG TPA: D-glycero-beta-D-manno-heptose 1-phosphate adenylyltransferase [Vicinamibacteria bacterium]
MTPAPDRAATLPGLIADRQRWAAEGRSVVLTNGCFDLLHPGHVFLLEAARSEGDQLVVAINSDRSVRQIKGEDRPLNTEAERAEALLALECVDRVVIYDDQTPAAIIDALVPDVLVKGADWALNDIVGRETVTTAGGRVVRVPLLAGQSTTAVVDRIRRT